MKTFIQNNKKLLIILGFFVVAITVGFIVTLITNSTGRNAETQETKSYNLSSIAYVGEGEATKYPATYDFITGKIGNYSVNIFNRKEISEKTPNFLVLLHKKNNDTMFCSYYAPSGTPLLIYSEGYKPQQVQESESKIKDTISDISDKSLYHTSENVGDGAYDFYIMGEDDFKIDVGNKTISFLGLSSGYICETVLSETENAKIIGLDTTFIRRYPNLIENWKVSKETDITDKFWDNARPNAVYVLNDKVHGTGKKIYVIPTSFYVPATQEYVASFKLEGLDLGRSRQEIDEMLENMGYESIDFAIANHQYATQQEYTDKLNADLEKKSKW